MFFHFIELNQMFYSRGCMVIKSSSLYSLKKLLFKYHHTGCIIVEPAISLVTDRVKIYGNGFKPNAPITVKASVECAFESISFQSCGHYYTTKDGEFDLSLCKSVGGTYKGIDCMGLFWSMVETDQSLNRLSVKNASIPKTYMFSVFDGHLELESEESPCCYTSVERRFIGKDIKRSIVKIGKFNGTLFTPSGEGPFGAIITIYGSNKHRCVIEDAAAILSNNGFITLAIQYFGSEGLPAVYTQEPIKLERFEAVVDYLLALENCHSVGVYGISQGAGIGIAMMSHLSKVKAVVNVNGPISSTATATTYKGKTTPQHRLNIDKFELLDNDLIDVSKSFSNSEDEPLSIHPFEFSSADLLLVVGMDDGGWRSEECSEIAKKRMDHIGKTNYDIFKCPGLGHLVDAPYMPVCTSSGHPLLPKGKKIYYGGKNKMMHSLGQESVWAKVISFFDMSLR